ncbi:hypothetical protein BV25DRAFT_1830960 [Artomyces pyxidatus]|uniref:Uncharacterized protein n=1 Tax=Artomyces pyxidatus TaxID=48021 RepID=A0ACB8SNM9_9AGAM|nr:hypothetical protein BV25DRAFT_1830960 [Artomyces pyxidatus]
MEEVLLRGDIGGSYFASASCKSCSPWMMRVWWSSGRSAPVFTRRWYSRMGVDGSAEYEPRKEGRDHAQTHLHPSPPQIPTAASSAGAPPHLHLQAMSERSQGSSLARSFRGRPW